jgi:hypothetical protein
MFATFWTDLLSVLRQSMVLKVVIPKLDQLIDELFELLPPTALSLEPKIGDIEYVGLDHIALENTYVFAGSDPVLLKMLCAVRDTARVSDRRVGHVLKSFAEVTQITVWKVGATG